MSTFSDLTAKPFSTAGAPAAPAPAPATQSSGGALSALVAKPFVAPAQAPAKTPVQALTSSPYFQGKEPSGTFIGISDKTDPFSDRPYLAYRVPGATATTTDYNRVASKVDPEIAAPTPRDSFTNPRLPESASQAIRAAEGATGAQQLDHRMALALGGSNNDSNLKLIPTAENQAAGKGEGQLSADVSAGKLSLFQAQVQEAANKGLPMPFVDQNTPPAKKNLLQTLSDAPDNSLLGIFRNTVLGLPGAAEDVVKATAGTVKGVADGIVKQYTDPSPLEKSMEASIAPSGPLTPKTPPYIVKAVLRTIVPMVEPFVNDATASIVFNNPELSQSFLKNANALVGQENSSFNNDDVAGLTDATNKLKPFADIKGALDKTNTQIIGDTAQAVLGAYFPEMFGESMAAFAAKGVLPAIGTTVVHGATAGFTFGLAQAASSGSKDPKELAGIVMQSTVAGALLNLGVAGILHGGAKTAETVGDVIKTRTPELIKKAKEGFKQSPGGYVKNPFYREPAPEDQPAGDESAPFEGQTFYRGVDKLNEGQIDSFYSADESVAADYGKTSKADLADLPKKPLTINDKDELAPLIGYKGDPFTEKLDTPDAQKFDTLAKQYAQKLGYDGIYYKEGSLNAPEIHAFGESTPKEKTTPDTKTIDQHTEDIKSAYAAQPTAQDHLDNMRAELFELSQPGRRIAITDLEGNPTGEIKAEHSTFPQWIPEDLRSADLFQKVFGGVEKVDDIKFPTDPRATKQRELYNELLGALDHSMGVDTSTSRGAILKQYETGTAAGGEGPIKKAGSGGPTGGQKGKGQKLNTGDPLVDTAAAANTPEEFYKNLTPAGAEQVLNLVDPDRLTYTSQEAAHAFYRDVHDNVLPDDDGLAHISTIKPSGKYVNSQTTEHNGGVAPPENKGGLQAPEIDWSTGKDIAAIRLSTDTMERNIEKMFPKQEAKEINTWLVEKVRTNETNRVDFVSSLRKRIRTEVVDKLGIKPRTKLSALVQQFGEGRLSLDELKKQAPTKYEDIGKAAAYFRNEYDTLLDKWNKARMDAGLNPIAKRTNYFRHFVALSEFAKNFGFDFRESNLPTAISGITEFFKSQTPWAGAALRRFGSFTTDDAVLGMDNYLDTASRAIFHTDSVQRGRLLEKYLRESATENTNARADLMDQKSDKEAPPPINMPNFASNLNDWVNLVSGKQARLDRAVESVLGRKVLSVMRTITRRFGLNVIGGNLSSAVTHAIPISYTLATVDKGAAFRGALDIVQAPFMADFNSVNGTKSAFLTRRFGTESIYPSVTDRIAGGLSAPFHWVDQFISRFTVASKYFEKISDGLSPEDAMKEADNYASRIIGDRSVGNLPNLMNTKTLGWLTQFQIEVNDNLKVLIHDIPKWESEKDSKIPVSVRVASRVVQFAFFSFLFNQLMQGIKGSGKGLDPIDMGLTLAGLNDEGHDKTLMERLGAVGGDLLKELPFTSLPTQGQIPALQPVIQAGQSVASGKYLDATKTLLEDFASPVGGGVQLNKTLTGIQAWQQGYLTDAAGKVIATIPPTIPALIQGGLFGANAFSAVKKSKSEINNLDATIKQQQAAGKLKDGQAVNILQQLRGMPADQAKQQLLTIAQQDPDMAKRVLAAAKTAAAGLTKTDTLIKTLGVANGARATYIVEKLKGLKTNEEKKAYLADLATKKLLTAEVLTQVTKQLSGK